MKRRIEICSPGSAYETVDECSARTGIPVAHLAEQARAQKVSAYATRYNRLAALSWGYWVMILGTTSALFVAANTAIPAVDLVRLMLIAGVAAPLVRFGLMERPPSDEE